MTSIGRPVVAPTVGDPNGIGPEIAVKAAVALANEQGPIPLIVADPFIVTPCIAQFAGGLPLVETAGERFAQGAAIHILPISALPRMAYHPGAINAEAGAATIAYAEAALRLCRAGGSKRSSAVRIRRQPFMQRESNSPAIQACWRANWACLKIGSS